MTDEFRLALEAGDGHCGGAAFSIATGVAAEPLMNGLLAEAGMKYIGLNGAVHAIKNEFFGHFIDVAGLVTGCDLIAQLSGKALGSRLLIPRAMLRSGEDVFLDDVTVEDLERELKVDIVPVPPRGKDLFDAIIGNI